MRIFQLCICEAHNTEFLQSLFNHLDMKRRSTSKGSGSSKSKEVNPKTSSRGQSSASTRRITSSSSCDSGSSQGTISRRVRDSHSICQPLTNELQLSTYHDEQKDLEERSKRLKNGLHGLERRTIEFQRTLMFNLRNQHGGRGRLNDSHRAGNPSQYHPLRGDIDEERFRKACKDLPPIDEDVLDGLEQDQ